MNGHATSALHSHGRSESLLNNLIGKQSLFVFLLLIIWVIVPVMAQSIPDDMLSSSPLPDAVKNEIDAAIARDISTKDIVEKEISTREQKLKEHPLSRDDSRSTRVNTDKFVLKETSPQSSVTVSNKELTDTSRTDIPYGGFIELGPDGKMRYFSSDGMQQYTTDDSISSTQSASDVMKKPSVIVPSGSTIRHIGKNTHISYRGHILTTIIDERQNDDSVSMNGKITHLLAQNELNLPEAGMNDGGSWVAWKQYHPTTPIKMFSADWKIPTNPSNFPEPKLPTNIIFNGVQPTSQGSVSEVLQPITAFNYYKQNAWTGEAMIYGSGSSIGSEYINLNPGDYVTGIVGNAHDSNTDELYWYITLWRNDVTSTQTELTYLLMAQHPGSFSMPSPDNVNLYLTYEAYSCHETDCPVPSDAAKCNDIQFSNINVYDENYNTISNAVWDQRVAANTPQHPGLTGIHIDGNTIETNSNTFSLIPVITGNSGGSITPSTTQTITKGGSQVFQIHSDHDAGYVIDKIIVDNAVNQITFSQSTVDYNYPFSNIQNDHSIEVSYKIGSIPTYAITPSTETGGSIDPYSQQQVLYGSSLTFTITPNSGNQINQVLVDGVVQTMTGNTYTFTNVQAPHTIHATFSSPPLPSYSITPQPSAGGTITPATVQSVQTGGSVTFTISPSPSYYTEDVIVSGESKGALTSYTFTNVQENSTISATFKPANPISNFTANTTVGTAPLSVQFTDTSIRTPTSWSWNFGDNNTSEQQNPVHTYVSAGNYTVSLTATNSAGSNTTVRAAYVQVSAPILTIPGQTNPPTDPDHDGLYEDLNGNGRLDFNDLSVFFDQMDWIEENEPVAAFDFNGNGRIDFNDLTVLFEEV